MSQRNQTDSYRLADSLIRLQSLELELLHVKLAHDAHTRCRLSRANTIRMKALITLQLCTIEHDDVTGQDIRHASVYLCSRLRIYEDAVIAWALALRRNLRTSRYPRVCALTARVIA